MTRWPEGTPLDGWDGVSIQEALLSCEVVSDHSGGYHLKFGNKLIPLGNDQHFAKAFQFVLKRNAESFEYCQL